MESRKYLLIGITITCLCGILANGQETSSTTDHAIEEMIVRDPICDGSNKSIQCGRTCGEYFVCAANKPTPVSINICPTTGPFCKSGFKNDYCDTTRDPARFMCQPLSFLFHCTDAGYFPDPIDCTAYYICVPVPSITNHFNAERRTCDTGLIYNGNARKCVVPNNSILCRTVNCEQSTSEFKTFPGYTQYFYNCVERSIRIPSGKIPVMYRCPGPTNVAFNSTSNTCYYNCNGWSQGRVAIPDKADEFYQCNYGSQALLESCPKPYLFSAARSICTNI